jgi:transcriptional regulator with XRE-family HTH domain
MAERTSAAKRSRRGPPSGEAHPVDLHVGRRIRLRRSLLAMSQEEVGERLGLSYQQVQRIESGSSRLSAGRLYELSLVLDVPVGWFFDDLDPAIVALYEGLRGRGDPHSVPPDRSPA